MCGLHKACCWDQRDALFVCSHLHRPGSFSLAAANKAAAAARRPALSVFSLPVGRHHAAVTMPRSGPIATATAPACAPADAPAALNGALCTARPSTKRCGRVGPADEITSKLSTTFPEDGTAIHKLVTELERTSRCCRKLGETFMNCRGAFSNDLSNKFQGRVRAVVTFTVHTMA